VTATGQLDGALLPVDLAANAESLGADVLRATTVAELRDALRKAVASPRTTVIHIRTDPSVPAPDSEAWWDVPVAEVSELPATREARASYEDARKERRDHW
jgi:3D-(3,5/4)-trihydroxycyclohexane-1,2-dione acylhydrolase (decyclizing)